MTSQSLPYHSSTEGTSAPASASAIGFKPVPDAQSAPEAPEAIPTHPLGVKPSGNGLLATWTLRSSIGYLQVLPDEMILSLLETLDSASLRALGSTCRALYAFTRSEELWKALFIE